MPQEEKERIQQQLSLIIISALIMILVAQLNFNLIINGFKISLAVICLPVFAFLLENFPSFPVTLVTAPGIMLARCVFEWLDGGSFVEAMAAYSPEMLFYLIYGGLFSIYVRLMPISHFRPIRLLPLVGIDMVSNIAEIFVRLGPGGFSFSVFTQLLVVALGRTALAMIFLAAFDAYGLFILKKDDRIRYQRLLLLISQLKSEIIWMNKNTTRIEETMAVSYSLYNELNAVDDPRAKQAAQKALTVAKDIHEVKKEYYLIMNGISSALNTDQEENGMWIKNICQVIKDSAQHVFGDYGQNLQIDISIGKNFYTDKHYFLMSVLRNLVTNAAEAAQDRPAKVVLSQWEEGEDYLLSVHDNCGGIDPEYLPTIFMPGFSTKINFETGQVSRGLGLCLVKDIIESQLGGTIEVQSEDGCTDFIIRIPKQHLEVTVK